MRSDGKDTRVVLIFLEDKKYNKMITSSPSTTSNQQEIDNLRGRMLCKRLFVYITLTLALYAEIVSEYLATTNISSLLESASTQLKEVANVIGSANYSAAFTASNHHEEVQEWNASTKEKTSHEMIATSAPILSQTSAIITSSSPTSSPSNSINVDDFCGECFHSWGIGSCQNRVDFLMWRYKDSEMKAKLGVLREQPLNCNRHTIRIPDQFTIDSMTGRVVAVKIDEMYALWTGSEKLCSILRNITNVTALGLSSEPPLFIRTSTPAPLINFTMNCDFIFKDPGSLGTGNWFYALYMVQLQAALARVDLLFNCLEGYLNKHNQILPWFSGFYNLSGNPNNPNWWPFDLDRPDDNSVCGSDRPDDNSVGAGLPLHLASHAIQRDMRRFALKQLGPRQGLPFPIDMTAVDLPPDLIPEYPNEDVDDVAIHFRCGDILGGDNRDDFGIIKFDEYKRRIFPEARTVGIATQPFDPDLMRPRDRSTAENCKRIVLLLVEYLTNNFPNITVTIRNSANDTLPLTWARLIMANQTIISLSSFGIFPCIGTFGQGYFQRGNSGVNGFNVHIPDILNNTHLMDSPVLTSGTALRIGIDEIAKWVVEPRDVTG